MTRIHSQAIAAFPGRQVPDWVAVPPPEEIAPEEVLCRTLQLGVCGTDREIIQSAEPWVPPGSEFLILGHECLARIEAIGSHVRGLEVGDLVVPSVRRTPGGHLPRPDMLPPDQYTERGIAHQHGYSQPLWLDDPFYLLRVPPQLAELAVFTEPQSVAEKAINEAVLVQQARLGANHWTINPPRVLVTGLGPIGFAGVVAARSRGWPVTLYGRDRADSSRVELARLFEAEYLNQQEIDLAALPVAQRFDLILECTGADEVLVAASQALAHCGALVWLGASRTAHPRPHNLDAMMRQTLMGNQVHLGAVNSAPRDFEDAIFHLLQLQRDNPRAAAGLITRRAAIGEALEHFTRREVRSIKTVFVYE